MLNRIVYPKNGKYHFEIREMSGEGVSSIAPLIYSSEQRPIENEEHSRGYATKMEADSAARGYVRQLKERTDQK